MITRRSALFMAASKTQRTWGGCSLATNTNSKPQCWKTPVRWGGEGRGWRFRRVPPPAPKNTHFIYAARPPTPSASTHSPTDAEDARDAVTKLTEDCLKSAGPDTVVVTLSGASGAAHLAARRIAAH